MAKTAGGSRYDHYLSLVSKTGREVERLSPEARKLYLKQQLRLVEAQIGDVLGHLNEDESSPPETMWTGWPRDWQRRESLSRLGYLFAERDALEDVLRRL